MLRRALLACGVVGSILYTAIDIIAGVQYPGYSFTAQAISELFAIGAPTSGLVVPVFTLSSLLTLAFAMGVWLSSGQSRALRLAALMFVGNAVNGLVLWNVFPMHMRGAEATFTDTMHILLAGVGVVFILAVVCIVAVAYSNWLRLYSIVAILILLVPGAAVFIYVPQLALGQPTPWVGLTERISSYGYFVWQAAFIIYLMRPGMRGESK